MKHVLIIGGGITGLSAAYHVQEQARAAGVSLRTTLLESDTRIGGKITTESVDGFTIDGGPDCFLSRKPWGLSLCRALGLGDDLMGTNDDRRQTFVLNRGKLTPLPDGVMLIIPTRIAPFVTSSLISWPGKVRMGMDLLIPPRRDESDETVADFVRRRLGQEALDKIAEPLMSGIHISDPERQSLLGSFPRFREMERKHGSLIKAMVSQRNGSHRSKASSNGTPPLSMFMSLRHGLGQLIQALEGALQEHTTIVTGKRVSGLDYDHTDTDTGAGAEGSAPTAAPRYQVRTEDGETFTGDAIVLATPAYVSASLLSHLLPPLSRALQSIRYVTTSTVSMGFRLADVGGPFGGFGFVIPRKEQRQITGCTWSSTKFNSRVPPEHVLLRCFIGGPGHEDLAEQPDDDLVAMVRRELGDIMGLRAEPVLTRTFRWNKANPQYDVGHLDRVREMHTMGERLPGLVLAGSAFEGVGVPDCIHQGQRAASTIFSYLIG